MRPPKDLKGIKTLAGFLETWEFKKYPAIEIDLTDVYFYDPWALAYLGAWAKSLEILENKTVTVRLNPANAANKYFQQFGFPQLFGQEPLSGIQSITEDALPLRMFKTHAEIPEIASQLVEVLSPQNEYVRGLAKYSLTELLRNVVQHSQSKIGGIVGAQLFPDRRIVQICVIDIGVGVGTTIRSRYTDISSNQRALKLALLPHVSGTFPPDAYGSMQDNAGLGLFFIKEMARRSYGNFFIAANGHAIHVRGLEDGGGRQRYTTVRDPIIGTIAVLEVRTNAYNDFTSLLGLCRQLAADRRNKKIPYNLDFVDERVEIEDIDTIYVREFDEDVEAAARIRDVRLLPGLTQGRMVVLDFNGIEFATQSFCHALLYKVFRDQHQATNLLSFQNCTDATKEAIIAVTSYARTD